MGRGDRIAPCPLRGLLRVLLFAARSRAIWRSRLAALALIALRSLTVGRVFSSRSLATRDRTGLDGIQCVEEIIYEAVDKPQLRVIRCHPQTGELAALDLHPMGEHELDKLLPVSAADTLPDQRFEVLLIGERPSGESGVGETAYGLLNQ